MAQTQVLKEKLTLALKGFCMGAADVVPGVSGGTMAFILGIYARWLAAIQSFDSRWLGYVLRLDVKNAIRYPHFGFVIPLALGIFCALIFFTRIIPLPQLLHTHPEIVYGLFFGLILGSILHLLREAGQFSASTWGFLILGIIAGWLVVNLVPVDTPDSGWFIFICGFVAISAMLLPGISGSFILLILRKYDTIFSAIGRFEFSIIIPFGLGLVAGLVVFSRFLTWLLARFYQQTLVAITGILIGSLWMIWPFQERVYIVVREKQRLISSTPLWPEAFTSQVIVGLVMMLLGLAIVLWLNYLSSTRKSA